MTFKETLVMITSSNLNKAKTVGKNLSSTAAQQASEQLKKKLGKKATSDTKGKLASLANVNLAEPMFSTGPSDDLLTVDILGVSDTNVQNSLSEKLSGFDPTPIEGLRRQPVDLVDLKSDVLEAGKNAIENDQKTIKDALNPTDRSGMLDRITKSIGSNGGINRLSQSIQQSLLAPRSNQSGFLNQARGLVNGQEVFFQTKNFNDYRAIFDLVNTFCRKTDFLRFFDYGADGSLLSGIICEFIKSGLGNSIANLLSCVEDPNLSNYGLRNSIPTAVSNGDIYTTNLAIDRLGSAQVLSQSPNAVNDIVSNFSFPRGTTSADHPALLGTFTGTINSLSPGGFNVDRSGVPASRLDMFTNASKDTKTLFSNSPYELESSLADSYPSMNLVEIAKTNYPYSPVG